MTRKEVATIIKALLDAKPYGPGWDNITESREAWRISVISLWFALDSLGVPKNIDRDTFYEAAGLNADGSVR